MPRKRISRKRVLNAIPGSGGVISVIARRAGYSWGATRDFIRNDPELAALLQAEEEAVNDLAESILITRLRAGDEAVARWWLAHRRRSVYGDNLDLNASGAIVIRVVREDYREVSDETEPTNPA